MVFASSYANVLWELKELFALSQILLLNTVYSKPDRYHDENAEILVCQFFKLIQEDIAIEAYIHFKVIYRIQLLCHVSQHDADHLRTIPLPWSYAVESSFRCDAVNAERAIAEDWSWRTVVHEKF